VNGSRVRDPDLGAFFRGSGRRRGKLAEWLVASAALRAVAPPTITLSGGVLLGGGRPQQTRARHESLHRRTSGCLQLVTRLRLGRTPAARCRELAPAAKAALVCTARLR
jgi:hypothetical protein